MAPVDGGCLLATLTATRCMAAVQGMDTSAHVERHWCTTNTVFMASKAPSGVVAHALLSGVHRAPSPAWPRPPTLWAVSISGAGLSPILPSWLGHGG